MVKFWLGSVFLLSTLVSSLSFAQSGQSVVEGEYIIKYKEGRGSVSAMNAKLSGKASLKAAFSRQGLYHVKALGKSQAKMIEGLNADPEIEYVEPNYILSKTETGEPIKGLTLAQAESYQSSSYSCGNGSQYDQSCAPIQIDTAWTAMAPLATHSAAVVAVIDTGTDTTHPYFSNTNTQSLWTNPNEVPGNGIDDDQNGYVDDVHGWNFVSNSANVNDDEGHGTHVAGIVVGAGQDIIIANPGVSKVKVMSLKFLNSQGSGSTANAIKAINYAIANGAKVINNSWGGPSYSKALHDAMTYAYNSNVVVVSAAGNYRSNNDASPLYPANYDVPSNLSVAATNDWDELASFSNFGATTVAVGSPGTEVLSTYPVSMLGTPYSLMSGTSMAAPLVAGLAGLARRENTDLNAYQVAELIRASVDVKSALSSKVKNSGRINARKLIQAAIDSRSSQVATALPSYIPSYQSERSLASEPAPAAGGCGLVKGLTGGSGPGTGGPTPGLVLVFMLPLMAWSYFRIARKESSTARRKFDRFKMDSKVVVKCGDRELVGQLNTISQGGVSFNADTALEKGGVVTMKIQSPDGNEVIEVQGSIVWSEKDRSYGVQFQQTRQGALAMIQDWTRSLAKLNEG